MKTTRISTLTVVFLLAFFIIASSTTSGTKQFIELGNYLCLMLQFFTSK